MKSNMTLEQFKKLLDEYDWYYSMSHDERAFTKGLNATIVIEKLCSENVEFKQLYEQTKLKMFPCNQKQ